MHEGRSDVDSRTAAAVDALARRIVLPLLAMGAVLVLFASILTGHLLEDRLFAEAAQRADAVLAQLGPAAQRADDPARPLAALDTEAFQFALLSADGRRVIDANPPELRGAASPALRPGPGFDGRYWQRSGRHVRADGEVQRFWMRLDLSAQLHDVIVQQLVVTLGGAALVSVAVALTRRRLQRLLLPWLTRFAAALDGAAVDDGAAGDIFSSLAARAGRLHRSLQDARARQDALRSDLAQQEALVRQAFELAPTPQLWCRGDGQVLAVNAAARRLLGLDGGSVMRIEALLPGATAERLAGGLVTSVRCRDLDVPVRTHALRAGADEWLIVFEDQSARVRTEMALRASEERYRRMFETCNEGIWVLDRNLCTVSANARLGELLGMTTAELLGRPVSQFVRGERETFVAELEATLAGAALPPREIALAGGNGARAWAMLSATALPGHERGVLVLMLADITSLKSAEQALREGEQRLAMAAANGGVTVWEYDCVSGALRFDRRHAGVRAGDVAAGAADLAALLALCHAEDATRVRQALADHVAGHAPNYDIEFRLADAQGGWRWVHSQGQVVERDAAGQARRLLGIQRDVTTEKLALEALATARDEALRATRVKSQFLANMSHELRTPLNGVLGMLSLLEREQLSDEQREFVDVAVKSGRSLFELINNVLDFSKIEAGALELERTDCDLRVLAEDVVDMLAEQAHQRGLDVLLRWETRLPRRVACDPARLRQVLLNLLGNAVKFTDRGHVLLRVAMAPANDLIRFEVEDTGVGIAPEQRQRIFEPFKQADESTTRRFGGTGLGLSITRQLVELMGGRLDLQSTPGQGSRFGFELPLAALDEPGIRPGSGLAGRRILLQEPVAVVAEAALELLRAQGASVERVREVREIRPALLAASPGYDLLLVAVGGDLQACAHDISQLRELPGGAPLAIVGTLPFGRRTGAEELRTLGVQGLLTKPLRESHVLRVLGDVTAPDAMEAQAARLARTRGAPGDERRALAALRVLVVDDVGTNLKVAAGMLARLGIQASLADSGRTALDAISSTEFQIVFMDCQMPGMDGFETTALIRQRYPAGEGPRIIAMTANAASTDRDRCLANGMDDYLAKPVLLSDLERVLHRWTQGLTVRPARAQPPGTDADKLEELLALLGAGEFDALRQRFRVDGAEQLLRLERAAAAGDAGSARHAAHALKGAAANLGATQLAGLCREAERMSPPELRVALHALRAAFDEFCATLMRCGQAVAA